MEISISKQQLIALFGSILVLIGVFLPALSVPILGAISLFNNGKGDGKIIIGLAVVAIILTVLNQIKALKALSIIILGAVGYSFYHVYSKISEMKKEMTEKLSGNMFSGFANAMMDSVQLQYGWVIIFIGAVILLFGAFVKIRGDNDSEYTEEHHYRGAITEGAVQSPVLKASRDRVCRYCNAELSTNSMKCNSCGSLN